MAAIGPVTGIVGGLIATVVMTAMMMALGDDSPPPTAALWATYVGDGSPDDYLPQGMALHFLYGIGAGLVFAAALAAAEVTDSLAAVVGGGVAYGAVLMVIGAALWMKAVLGMDPDRRTVVMFGIFHLTYGLVLGVVAWFVPLG